MMALLNRARVRPDESRGAHRFVMRPEVSLILANGALARGRLMDMSVAGAFLETVERPFGLEPGETGTLGLLLPPEAPDGDHRFWCEVIRVTNRGVALRFISEREYVEHGSSAGSTRQLMPDDFME
ncbi:MAG: PilZ domain-containing protein [Magnetococcales bacterium]|nr:PilZ domain-containing protein [Magnetococcales bacterium]